MSLKETADRPTLSGKGGHACYRQQTGKIHGGVNRVLIRMGQVRMRLFASHKHRFEWSAFANKKAPQMQVMPFS
jgi:hypothetical protein